MVWRSDGATTRIAIINISGLHQMLYVIFLHYSKHIFHSTFICFAFDFYFVRSIFACRPSISAPKQHTQTKSGAYNVLLYSLVRCTQTKREDNFEIPRRYKWIRLYLDGNWSKVQLDEIETKIKFYSFVQCAHSKNIFSILIWCLSCWSACKICMETRRRSVDDRVRSILLQPYHSE